MTLSLSTEEVSQVNGLQQIFHPVVDFRSQLREMPLPKPALNNIRFFVSYIGFLLLLVKFERHCL